MSLKSALHNIQFKNNRLFFAIQAVTIVLMVVIVLGFLISISDRGLEITDEGMYLLGSRLSNEIPLYITAAHWYTGMLFALVKYNVVYLRLLWLPFVLLSAAVFYLGFWQVTRLIRPSNTWKAKQHIFAFCFLSLGALYVYVTTFRTPYYNQLNAFALTTSSGLVLLGISLLEKQKVNSRGTMLSLFSAGICAVMSFFVKFPTGICLFALFPLFLLCWPRLQIKRRLFALLWLTLGIASGFVLHFIIFESFSSWLRMMRMGLEYTKILESGHGSGLLMWYYQNVLQMSFNAFNYFWPLHTALIGGFAFFHILRRLGKEMPRLPIVFLVAVFVAAAVKSYSLGLHYGGFNCTMFESHEAWSFLLFSAAMLSFLYRRDLVQIELNAIDWRCLSLLILFLAALPFCGAVGTGAWLGDGIIYNMAPWFGLMLLLLELISWAHRRLSIRDIGILLIGALACVQVISAYLLSPHRLNAGILQQSVPTDISYPVSQLKLDPKTCKFINTMRNLATQNGFKYGDDLLAFYNMPGLVFALGGKSPGTLWYSGGYKGSIAAAEYALSLVDPERLKNAFILQEPNPMPDLSKFGIDFPGGYELCGSVTVSVPVFSHSVKLWKPLSKKNGP